jgi:autotransporter-associated beta strand protein
MGDLKIGAGQSIFFNKNDAATDRTVAFQTVTLTGGTPTFSVYDRNFRDNANAFVGPNVELGAIGESTPGSGVIFKSQGGDTAVAPFPHVTITGTASYTGTTTVAVGTLQVGAGGTSGTLGSGDVIDNGLLLFNRSDTLVVPNDISGTGAVTNAGDPANVLDLNGAQDYATLNADSGTTHLHGSFTAGTATVNVLATLGIGADQSIGSLNIADGAIVSLDSALAAAPGEFAAAGSAPAASESVQAVPEPGSISLLVLGALGWLGRRQRSRYA